MVILRLSMPESNNQKFNHLKIHSQYSICEGAIKIDNLKDIDEHLKTLDSRTWDYIENYYKYLRWLYDEKHPKEVEVFDVEKNKTKAKKWLLKKIKNVPIIWDFLEKAFEWFSAKPNENDNWWNKMTKPIFSSMLWSPAIGNQSKFKAKNIINKSAK